MATPAQIAANRRNALKSTGPKSAAGRARAAKNATRHGLTGAVPRQIVAAMYRKITGSALPEDPGAVDPLALRLATAEGRLAMARGRELDMLREGSDGVRFVPERELISDALLHEWLLTGTVAGNLVAEAEQLQVKLAQTATRNIRQVYPRTARYLRAAEREHADALHAWVSWQ